MSDLHAHADMRKVLGLRADIVGLRNLSLYGLKGARAYAHHANVLGYRSDEVDAGIEGALDFLADPPVEVEPSVTPLRLLADRRFAAARARGKDRLARERRPIHSASRARAGAGARRLTRRRIRPRTGRRAAAPRSQLIPASSLGKESRPVGVRRGEVLAKPPRLVADAAYPAAL